MIKNADQITTDVNIIDVVGKYITLKRRGVNYIGLCPLHGENTPSFNVYPATNSFYCFGCCKGGSTINFLMEHQNMTYPEALEAAASEGRIEVEYENKERRQEDIDRAKAEKAKRMGLAETLQTVHRYYADHGALPGVYCDLETKKELVDADGRLIKRDTADTFGICLTPDDNLVHKAGFWEKPALEEIGVLGKGDYGHYDFFKKRLLFRITDHQGKITALAGRRLRAEDTPPSGGGAGGGAKQRAKYINSRDSILYNKSETLFGLFENRRGIKDAGFAILVEGYFDVITPHDHGICNAVAPCGTALTDAQAKLLKRFTDEVVILRDGDQAGLEAAKRDVETLVRAGLKVRICQMKPGAQMIRSMLEQREHIIAQQKEVDKYSKLEPIDKKMKKERAQAEALLATMRDNMTRMQGDHDALKDPDTFLRRHGRKGFDLFIEETSQDGIIWRVMEEYEPNDVYSKETAT
ncbi:MAG TPA: CHC2 zinc finger domain-containing protein, partial [Saprospiraceae bacterium]|nr:CHC2 zinc finger domain-containing protein [Saprospiraceae bacterium]